MDGQQIAVVRRPEVMRWLLLVVIAVMSVPCILIALSGFSASPATSLLMLGFVIFGVWLGRALFLTDATAVMFDGQRIYDDTGLDLCTLDEIEDIERGLAFFKPSGGLVIVLKTPGMRGWSPGLWWRFGRRLGIGGATPARAGKNMADAIMGAMAARNAV